MNNEEIVGTVVVVLTTMISVCGVIANNLVLDHIAAMQIWMVSNILFVVFFYGEYKRWWDGALPSLVLCGFYAFCTITGMYGLWFA